MAATLKELEELHRSVANSLKGRIDADIADNIPTDAATLSAAIKFLKDNNVTADPAGSDDLSDLRDKLIKQAEQRKKAGAVLALCKADQQAMEG